MNQLTLVFLVMALVSCSSIIRTRDGAESVKLFFMDNTASDRHIQSLGSACEFVGEVTGSEGHWYSYWFISNTLMIQGALSDLRNSAYARGGNIVVVYCDFDFTTSVTLFGQAYNCSPAENKDKARF